MTAANVAISSVELAMVLVIDVVPISLHSHMSVFGVLDSFSALSLARSAISVCVASRQPATPLRARPLHFAS